MGGPEAIQSNGSQLKQPTNISHGTLVRPASDSTSANQFHPEEFVAHADSTLTPVPRHELVFLADDLPDLNTLLHGLKARDPPLNLEVRPIAKNHFRIEQMEAVLAG